ncbi:MAG: hypothetical protein IIC58_12180 [Proteobacteria bacterium]|nr:hypothetical protein [Pseudomonadota bacterium]
MSYFLKLKHWELFLMVVLPLALTYMLGFKYTVPLIGSIVLFMIIVVFSWIFSIGLWANQNLPQDQSAEKPDPLRDWFCHTACLYRDADSNLLSNP